MSVRNLLLLFSIAINITVAAMLCISTAKGTQHAGKVSLNTTIASENMSKSQNIWGSIQTDDFAENFKKLIEAGIPAGPAEEIVRKQIHSKIWAKYASLLEEKKRPYWQMRAYDDTPNVLEARNKFNREVSDKNKEIFGQSIFDRDENLRMESLRLRYGNISDERILEAEKIRNDVGKRYSERMKEFPAPKTPEEEAAATVRFYAYLDEQRTEMEKFFTPDEFMELSMRLSSFWALGGTQNLRSKARFMNITEEEYRMIYPAYAAESETVRQAEKNANTNIVRNEGSYAEYDKAVAEAAEIRKAQVRAFLGEERYADLVQSSAGKYYTLNRIVERLQLPLSSARAVVSVQNDITERATAISDDNSLSTDERAARLNALAQEAESRITETLGSNGYEAYRKNSQNWIQSLESGKVPSK